ncbi:hypothetical protein DFH08DRAFT_823133 [Mycena albidolilacea]|uniref:Uncharacterized protein n=1 Tax=Mycena albidolilacea TaxID=1033008 RepID=A0AAD6Z7M4_9AGAR|nr:hypothetical protein DFH08DRAFT_823133 [Mycena albidolilacea]
MGKVKVQHPKKPSAAQQAHMKSLGTRANKENTNPVPVVREKKAMCKPKNYKTEFTNSQQKAQLQAEKLCRETDICTLENAARKFKDVAAQRENQLLISHTKFSGVERVTSELQQANRALATCHQGQGRTSHDENYKDIQCQNSQGALDELQNCQPLPTGSTYSWWKKVMDGGICWQIPELEEEVRAQNQIRGSSTGLEEHL